MTINAIITAGGTSSRFGNKNKLLEIINGKEVIKHTVDVFEKSSVDKIIICANKSVIEDFKNIFRGYNRLEIIEGGETRQQSVYNGLKHSICDYVLIHDAARPVINVDLIELCISTVKDKNAISVMTKTVDTIKEVVNDKIVRTIDRSKLYNTQTPQAFKYDIIMEAHQKFAGQSYTDDAGMVEALGEDVYIVNGSYKNIKITTQNDIDIAKVYLAD